VLLREHAEFVLKYEVFGVFVAWCLGERV